MRRAMCIKARPYFLKNEEWYTKNPDPDGERYYILTDKAPKKARESYEEFYSEEDDELRSDYPSDY